jgi:glycerophosphoryl diester phosphodiesterase
LRAAGPLLYAHRGASKERPENTIPSFQRGIELGADVLELDVHPSRDGTFVVSHDPDGERTCGVPRPIADCTWAELSGWDAGFGFVDERGARPFAGTGIRLARFDEVLDEFPATPLNVDVKLASSNEVQRLTALIHARGAEGRVLLTSFSWRCLRRVARAGYGGPRGLSRLDVVGLRFAPAALLQRRSERRVQIPEHAGPVDLSARWFIERCQSLGLGVDYWVVNAPERARALLEAGADGIFTDDVAAIAALFREALQTAAWRERHLDLDLR